MVWGPRTTGGEWSPQGLRGGGQVTFLQPSRQPERFPVCDQLLASQTAPDSQPHPRPEQAPTLLHVVTQQCSAHGKFDSSAPPHEQQLLPQPRVFFLKGDERCPPQKVLEGGSREDPRI